MADVLKSQILLMLVLVLIPVACGGGETAEAPPEAEPADVEPSGVAPDLSEAGSVSGKVNFAGTQPKMARIRMGAEPACEKKHTQAVVSQEVRVNDNGTLKYVFVWVKEGLGDYKFETPSQSATLDQDGCIYEPHVFGVQTKQNINILNSDPITHNIHPLPKNNREWNISQSGSQEYTRSFPRQEVMIPVKCNIHPWMKSYIGVVAHPYFAVTGEDGSFALKDLPPGDYTIQAWHERFGTLEQQVTVGPKESKEVDFSFEG
jgi:hypothetical protein